MSVGNLSVIIKAVVTPVAVANPGLMLPQPVNMARVRIVAAIFAPNFVFVISIMNKLPFVISISAS